MNIPQLTHKCSLVMCSWRSPHLLKAAIPALLKGSVEDTKIFVALNQPDKESIDFLLGQPRVQFVRLDNNYGTLAVDALLPLLKSEYSLWLNDDMMFSYGWDKDIIDDLENNYPAAVQIRGVEKRHTDGTIALSDLSLPDFTDPSAYDVFNFNVTAGKYNCNKVYGLFHPILTRTKDLLAVNGYTDNFDINWWPGHSMDTYFAYKLWRYNSEYRFILSNTAFDYHGCSMTNKKLKAVDPAADNRHNSEYFFKQTGMTHREFHKIVNYGEKI